MTIEFQQVAGVTNSDPNSFRHAFDPFPGYQRLLDIMPAAVYLCDRAGHIVYYNEHAERLWGRKPQIGDVDQKFCGALKLYLPDGRILPHDETPMALALQTGQSFRDAVVVIERADGTTRTVLVSIDPLFDDDGNLTGAVNVFQDVTMGKRLSDENRRQRTLLERIIANAPIGIALLEGPEYRYTLANPTHMKIARGKGDVLGRTVANVWPELRDTIIPVLDDVYRHARSFTTVDMPLVVEREAGPETAYITFTYTPIQDSDGRVERILALSLETTGEVLAKKGVERKRAFLHAVLAQMPSGVLVIDAPSGDIIVSNEQVAAIHRRAKVPQGNVAEYAAVEHFHPDGRLYNPAEWPVSRSLNSAAIIQNDEMVFRRGDGTEAIINVSSAPILDEEGAVSAAVAIFHDITESKAAAAERERLLAALELERTHLRELTETLESSVAQRTSQVRSLASALHLAEQRERARIAQVLHDDLQQLLYSQLMRVELLRQDLSYELRGSVHELLASMSDQLEQAIRITRLLTAELNPPKLQAGDLKEGLQWLAEQMQQAHNLCVELSGDMSSISDLGDTRDLLLQIVRELLFNVVKHARVERVTVSVSTQDDELIIRVEDQGAGFDAGAPGQGRPATGMGLQSIASRLALIGGRFEMRSAPGAGTCATIMAPLT